MSVKESPTTKHHLAVYMSISALCGAIVGLLYLAFEWITKHGTLWLWNDVVQSDTYRWRVIPLAIIMSVVLSVVIKLSRTKRILPPPLGLLDELDDIHQTRLVDIFIIIVIGALSLIAGASLGPEASLVAACLGISALLAGKIHALQRPFAFVLSLASVGALLAAFFNSLLPLLIPVLILKKKQALDLMSFSITSITVICAWLIVLLIKGKAYISIPVADKFTIWSVLTAAAIGFAVVLVSVIVKYTVKRAFDLTSRLDHKLHWLVNAVIFGSVLGLLYFLGGQTIQFSGSEGLKLLSENPSQYGIAALLGLIVTKLLATAWSTATGYRGGLVFPSIYVGVVLSLVVVSLLGLSGANEAGAIIGAVTGILMGMLNPIIGIVLALALFPFGLYAVVIGAGIGAIAGQKLITHYAPNQKAH